MLGSMGLLLNGVRQDESYDTRKTAARFVREKSSFQSWVTADGSSGPTRTSGFKAEPARYHLHAALVCPWAHRTLIVRKLKKLADLISVSVVDPFMGPNGWAFAASDGSLTHGSTPDTVNGARYLYEIYLKARQLHRTCHSAWCCGIARPKRS